MADSFKERGRSLEGMREALIKEDVCPECLGELDTGWECTRCSYDALEEYGEYLES